MSIKTRNIKYAKKWQKEIIENAESVMYACRRDEFGDLERREVIKCNGKYYRIETLNRRLKEFTEV